MEPWDKGGSEAGRILEAVAPTERGREPVTAHTATCHVASQGGPVPTRAGVWPGVLSAPLHQSFLLRGWARALQVTVETGEAEPTRDHTDRD